MQILRKGEQVDKSYIFECKKCGCIWQAEKGEYWETRLLEEGWLAGTWKGRFGVYCDCPNCDEKAAMEGRYKEYGGNGIFDKYKVDLSKILETENEG